MNWLKTEINRKYHKVADLFPLLSGIEFNELKADIAANGLLEAISLHPDGSIIDGRNRHRACIETETRPHFRTWDGQGSLVAFVVSLNLRRRHLNSSQRAMISLDVLPMLEKEAAKKREETQGRPRKTGGNISTSFEESEPKSRDQAAAMFQTNPRYVQEAKRIQEQAPDLGESIKAGEITIPKAKRKLEQRLQQQQEQIAIATMPEQISERFELFCGDFAEIAHTLEPESIDVIITDPPYPKEYVGLYAILAEQAQRLLKPGGSLLAMAGQSYLPVLLKLMTPHIAYHWTLSYLTPGGQSPQIWHRKVNTFWKPVLWFVKGNYKGNWHGDVVKSDVNDNDKRFHRWGQSESGMARLVEKFSDPGDLILDPFCGGGTTGIVSIALNRRFVGIDIEQDCIRKTQIRILETGSVKI